MMTVEGLGMPFHKRTFQHGNLIIQFKIKFPNSVDQKSMKLLTDALNGTFEGAVSGAKTAGKDTTKEDETCYLKSFEENHRNTDHRGGQGGHDSEEEDDEEGHGHGQRVGCQAQ